MKYDNPGTGRKKKHFVAKSNFSAGWNNMLRREGEGIWKYKVCSCTELLSNVICECNMISRYKRYLGMVL